MNRILSFLLGIVVGAGVTVAVFLLLLPIGIPFVKDFIAQHFSKTAQPVVHEIALEKQKPILGTGEVLTKSKAAFTVLEKEYFPHNRIELVEAAPEEGAEQTAAKAEFNNTYPLDSNYATVRGTLVPYNYSLGETGDVSISFYNVDPHGTEELLQEYTASIGDPPAEIELDISDVNYLRIFTNNPEFVFYDIYLVEKPAAAS